MDRLPLDTLALQLYEKANELGLEVVNLRTFESQLITVNRGSAAHSGFERCDKVKLKFCPSGNFTLVVVRRKNEVDPMLDRLVFLHKGNTIASDLVKALLRIKNKMTYERITV